MNAITIKNLNKKFGEQVVLHNFSMSIKENTMVAIVGKSGRGKTTLLNIMGGLDMGDSGEVYLYGEDYSKPSRKQLDVLFRNKVSYLFQNSALIHHKTVYDNLKIATRYANYHDVDAEIKNSLKKVGLPDSILDKNVFSISGGEQQRVAFARLLLKPSSIILADEPTGNLDYDNALIIFKLIETLKQEHKTIVVVTHDLRFLDFFDEVQSLE
mgnify:CR=1 FL=1